MGMNSPAIYGLDSNVLDLPSKVHYFQSFFLNDTVPIHDIAYPLVTILSIHSNVSLLTISLCDNSFLFKSHHKLNRGLIVKCELKVELKLKYVCGSDGKSIKFSKKEFFKPVYIVVPEFIGDESVMELMRKNKFTSFIYVENLNTKVIDTNEINFSMISLINISFH